MPERFDCCLHSVLIRRSRNDRELVAADAEAVLGPVKGLPDAAGRTAEQLVTGTVAVLVVGLLEPVDVHNDVGPVRALGPAGLHILEGRIVEKPGQRVGVGQLLVVFQLGLFVDGLPDAVEHDAAQHHQKSQQTGAVAHGVSPASVAAVEGRQRKQSTRCQHAESQQDVPHLAAVVLFIGDHEGMECCQNAGNDGDMNGHE